MPVKDIYHNTVKKALINDGWSITHDPYTITFGQKNVFVDLGAERLIAAEKGAEKIAIETKSFLGASEIHDFEIAIGQYVFYRSLLMRYEPDRKLFLAVPESVFVSVLNESITQPVLDDLKIDIFSFDPHKEVITKWNV